MNIRTSILFSLLAIFTIAHAEIDTNEYLKARKAANQDFLKVQISGILAGYFWANVQLKNRKQEELYCVPPLLAINAENAIYILDEWTKRPAFKNEEARTSPLGLTLLFALQDQFPCK